MEVNRKYRIATPEFADLNPRRIHVFRGKSRWGRWVICRGRRVITVELTFARAIRFALDYAERNPT